MSDFILVARWLAAQIKQPLHNYNQNHVVINSADEMYTELECSQVGYINLLHECSITICSNRDHSAVRSPWIHFRMCYLLYCEWIDCIHGCWFDYSKIQYVVFVSHTIWWHNIYFHKNSNFFFSCLFWIVIFITKKCKRKKNIIGGRVFASDVILVEWN